MRWFRRGIVIRLAIYVPLIAFLAWRSAGGCETSAVPEPDEGLRKELAPYRKVITLPDGTQQEIVELTAEEAEAILGHPIPRDFHDDAKAGDAKADDAKVPPNAEASDGPAEPSD